MWAAIPPGKTADTGKVTGKFERHAVAVLRVYEGKLNLSGILAVSRDQPNRLDLPLRPGENHFTITQQGEKLFASPDESASPSAWR
jgi:hypothetical protein